MNMNVGTADRIIRVIVGLMLIALAIWSNISYAWLGYAGIIPLITGLFGTCPVYSMLGISTCPIKPI
jgi:hypothetical protein